MNPPKADELDYIHFLIAAQKVFTCTEAARCQPNHLDPPAHDAFTRLLTREPPDTEASWEEAKPSRPSSYPYSPRCLRWRILVIGS